MPNQIDATALAGSVGAQDLSIWSLFLNADWIGKLVLLLLVVASFLSSSIIFEKAIRIRRLRARADALDVRRRADGMARLRAKGPARHRAPAAEPAGAHRAGHGHHPRPRD